jgi:murein DD-endopeptidase MepM/ murein hydrolase activator NlpD
VRADLSVVPKMPAIAAASRQTIVAKDGDTVESILVALGVPAWRADNIAVTLLANGRANAVKLATGDVLSVQSDPKAGMKAPHDVELYRAGKPPAAVIRIAGAAGARYRPVPKPAAATALFRPVPTVALQALPHGTLRQALDAMQRQAIIGKQAHDDLSRLVARDYDLDRPLSPADSAQIIYSGGAVAYLALTVDGNTHRFYRTSEQGTERFYDKTGRAAPIAFMRKPLKQGELGDGFAWRIHPILHIRLFHEGVDYAAPYGTPIEAAAPGTVERIGWESGYGNYVRIRHKDGYATVYAHIARAAHGLKVGQHVHRGQIIAKVGSTGLSTGPHLYFELWRNGKRVDPLHAPVNIVPTLKGDALSAFDAQKQRLNGIETVASRLLSRVVPPVTGQNH